MLDVGISDTPSFLCLAGPCGSSEKVPSQSPISVLGGMAYAGQTLSRCSNFLELVNHPGKTDMQEHESKSKKCSMRICDGVTRVNLTAERGHHDPLGIGCLPVTEMSELYV